MWQKVARLAGLSLLGILACGALWLAHYERVSLLSLARTDDAVSQELKHSQQDSPSKEYSEARRDHVAIALAVGQCYSGQIGSLINWSPMIRAVLMLRPDEPFMDKPHSGDGSAQETPAVPKPPGAAAVSFSNGLLDNRLTQQTPPVLNPLHTAAVSFSDRLSRDRLVYGRELEENRSLSRSYQIWILVLSAAATIFVTLRSMMGQDQASKWTLFFVGFFAIVLSAAGTAVSSMSSFDGSQAIALRDQRTLSQLQQLHWRIASDVMSKPELCKKPESDPAGAIELVGAWRTRLEAILDNAVDSISRPGDISSGQQPSDARKPVAPTQVTSAQ